MERDMKSTLASRFALIGTTAMALGLGMSHAYAATPDDKAPTHVVRYADLDLSQPSGAQRLYQRIQIAARIVCENPMLPALSEVRAFEACVRKAVNQAVAQVGSARVTQIHEAAIQRDASRS
jgi:UrcA family protein